MMARVTGTVTGEIAKLAVTVLVTVTALSVTCSKLEVFDPGGMRLHPFIDIIDYNYISLIL